MNIDTTAIVSKEAEIDSSVKIGAYSIIDGKVKIAAGTVIGPHVVIKGDTEIGENNRIFQFSSIGEESLDLKYKGDKSSLIIGNNNTIREFVTIHKGTFADDVTVIGNNNLFMNYVHVSHDCKIGNFCVIANSVNLGGHVVLGNHLAIGSMVGVHQFVKLGDYSFIAAMSRITKDVIPFALIAGTKPRVYGLNLVGIKRKGFDKEKIKLINSCYDLLFKGELLVKDSAKEILEQYPNFVEAKLIAEFLLNSEKGIYMNRVNNDG